MKITAKRFFVISKTILILVSILFVFKIDVFADEWVYDSFETEESLSCWTASDGGSIEISTERYKIDKSSMKWSYKNGGSLKLSDCSELSSIKSFRMGNGFKLWIYSTNKTDADMIIKIGNSETIDSTPSYIINVNMDFEGWRCIWARVNEFAQTGYSNADADTLLITLPTGMGEGVMYLDSFEVTGSVHYAACADFQIRNMPVTNTTYQYASYMKIPESTGETECTNEHKEAFTTIKKRLDDYILDTDIDYSNLDEADPVKIRYNQTMNSALSRIKTHNSQSITRREDGSIDAPGLTSSVDTVGIKLQSYEKTWVALALDWKVNKNEQSKQKLFDLFDYCYEQGWAEGSSMGAMRFDEIRADGYAFAVYMMKEELKETGRWERELANLKWRSEFGYVFAYNDPEIAVLSSVDADKMRSVVLFQLMYILCMEDTPEKVGYMKAYTKYFNDIVMPRTGSDGGIKNDYTMWHHSSPYMSSYGAEAINILCQIKYLIDGTCFDASDETTNILKKTLDTYRISSDKYDVPMRVRGRFPEQNNTMIKLVSAYAFLAACGDKNSAETFLDLWDVTNSEVLANIKVSNPMPSITYLTTVGQMLLFEQVKEKALSVGYEAATASEGVYIFPYGGYAVFRKDNRMAAISGFSKYIWDYEGSISENFYGRYTNYGSLILSDREGYLKNGINVKKGWDWARWPGTTAKYLTNDELELKGVSQKYSDETFLGGVAVKDGNGIYAMKLHDTAYDTSLYAKKSWFFLGDRIVCLGSDISNSDTEHSTQTTLFQNVMTNSAIEPISINGETVYDMAYEKSFNDADTICLTDTVGNGYIIPAAQGLVVERKENASKRQNGTESTGELAMAYLNHGNAPDLADYEYVVLPGGNKEQTALAAQNLGYEVLKKDSDAHIIKNIKNDDIGYVIFGSNTELSAGCVKTVTEPCIIMENRSFDVLKLSLCDPDLRIKTSGTIGELLTKSEEKATRVELFGEWKIVNGSEMVEVVSCNGNTVLDFICSDGAQLDVVLKKVPVLEGSIELCNDSEIYINEDFSTGVPPTRSNKGVWSFSGASRYFDNGELTTTSKGVGQIKLDTAVTADNEADSTNKYVLRFDVTRMGNAAGESQFFQTALNAVRYKDMKMILSEDKETYGINMIYKTNEGTRELVSGIPVGEFITLQLVYNLSGDYTTMDLSVQNSKGELIGNQFKDYKICNQELSTSAGFDEFYFLNFIVDESIKYDNIQFYKYKTVDEISISELYFTGTDGKDVSLDAVKEGEEIALSAEFNVIGKERGTAFVAIYDEGNRLVAVALKELTSEGKAVLSQKLFRAEYDGRYKAKVFLWKDSKTMEPIEKTIELY